MEEILNEIEKNYSKITYLCLEHFKNKKLLSNNIKEFLLNYSNYDRYLNDMANIIYNQYESSIDEVYKEVCNYFNEEYDNKYLYEYRLKRVINQDPKVYLQLDEDIGKNALKKLEDRINLIYQSTYYKKNKEKINKDLFELVNELKLVQKALGR
ncbi:hypothetical protein CP985_01890 [Malaciobacter mytili LMG 24559]|uniref:Uncharacterized protein n=1 Tax=Malaciobacter mytili LMG 24559 TaxID=1032238 RepID=A0AAX2ALG8_9BACT|nr:hypothetical protein [Malaciobacter mytili]AXH15027.1 hypothetical protein AMYT_1451 [Malaciobacter mytili LMG 24559]RXK16711.1 hypothetical protein CP985_01890 [Malaciobacter mytili LMG 24559]